MQKRLCHTVASVLGLNKTISVLYSGFTFFYAHVRSVPSFLVLLHLLLIMIPDIDKYNSPIIVLLLLIFTTITIIIYNKYPSFLSFSCSLFLLLSILRLSLNLLTFYYDVQNTTILNSTSSSTPSKTPPCKSYVPSEMGSVRSKR